MATMDTEAIRSSVNSSGGEVFDAKAQIGPDTNLTVDDLLRLLDPANYPSSYISDRATRHSLIIAFYSTIVLVSLFGNLFVCYVITKRRRMRTRTNFLMTNMAVSDLFMTGEQSRKVMAFNNSI